MLFFRDDERYFKTRYINGCGLNISFVLPTMGNVVACNDIVYSVLIMTRCIFCQKSYSIKTGWHYVVACICYITLIKSNYFL